MKNKKQIRTNPNKTARFSEGGSMQFRFSAGVKNLAAPGTSSRKSRTAHAAEITPETSYQAVLAAIAALNETEACISEEHPMPEPGDYTHSLIKRLQEENDTFDNAKEAYLLACERAGIEPKIIATPEVVTTYLVDVEEIVEEIDKEVEKEIEQEIGTGTTSAQSGMPTWLIILLTVGGLYILTKMF